MELPTYYRDWQVQPPLILKEQSNADYHAGLTHISASWLKKANDSLFEFLMYPLAEKKDSAALRLGSLVHTMLQEPSKIDTEYRFFDGFTTKANKEARDEALKEGFTVATTDEREKATAMIALASQDPLVKTSLKSGNIEHSFYWNADYMVYDERLETEIHVDLPLKSRLDQYVLMNNGSVMILDVKTTADLHDYNRTIANFKYAQQAAMQVEAIRVCLGKEVSSYYYLFIENDFPYDYRLVRLPLEYIEQANYKNQLLLKDIQLAKINDNWIPDRRVDAVLPNWYV